MTNTIRIPHTELDVFPICLGTANAGAAIDRETSFAMLDAYVAAGGNFLDSAAVYANWIPGPKSSSERTLGEWMKARGNRVQVIIATKGGHPDLETMHIPRLSPQEIVDDLDASLEHLQTDTIDLYYLHRDDPSRPVGDMIAALNAQIQAGKVRYIGCSNWRRERIKAAQRFARANEMHGFVANQLLWNLAKIEPAQIGDKTIVPMTANLHAYHQQTGLAAVAFSSQANGLFQKLETGRLDRMGRGALAMYDLDETRQRLFRIKAMQSETGLSITQTVLAYLCSQPFPTVPIVGCRNPEQLADSLQAANARLSPAQIARLTGGE